MTNRKLIIVTLFAFLFSIPFQSFSQIFKVSAVESTKEKEYDKLTRLLGKTQTLNFYDNSVTIKMENEPQELNLRKDSNTKYSRTIKSGYSTISYTLTIKMIFSYMTSTEIQITEYKSNGLKRETNKIIAKR